MSSVSNVLEKARELGEAIVNSPAYNGLREAENQFYNDKEASKMVSRMEEMTKDFNHAIAQEDLDKKRILLDQINKLKEQIDNNEVITRLYESQKAYDKLTSNVNAIIDHYTGNQKSKKGCSGCSGCNK